MKKSLLIATVCFFIITATAQTRFTHFTGTESKVCLAEQQMHPGQVNPMAHIQQTGQKRWDNTIIGTTYYDAQAINYGNAMQKLYAYPDGTVGATWQCSDVPTNLDRGTGYNYFNGNDWGTPDLHVGTDARTGYPNYSAWGPNGEILCHYHYVGAGSEPIKFYKRENKGEGEWIETVLNPPDGADVSIVWHSMITSGAEHEYIHLLAYTYDNDYQGQTNALLYYRSSDGAETWEIDGIIIDGLGADYFETISALGYAWANPVGETIAFTYGFDEYGGRVFKSTDNGDNWDVITVFEGLDPLDPPDFAEDFGCGIGSSGCVLDSQGNVHVVFPRMVKRRSGDTTYYYPYTDGLIYWNETMPELDTATITTYTLDLLEANGNLCGYVMSEQPTITIPSGQPNYANALCGFPQISIDEDDNIFVVSSTLAPDYVHPGAEGYFYRHIVLNRTFDLGATWEGQIDMNDDLQYIFSECAYPLVPKVATDLVHILFQEDGFPGTFEWPEEQNDQVENRMMYMGIDKGLLGVGIEEDVWPGRPGISVFPNPASQEVWLQIGLEQTSDLTVTLHDPIGRTIKTIYAGTAGQGRQRLSFDVSSLAPGVYFVRARAGNGSITRRVVVR